MKLFAALVCLLLLTVSFSVAAPVELVKAGQSAYVIYHAADAPGSVKTAAADLQSYLEQVTGAKLPLVTEPKEPMICLGTNASATAAGVTVEKLPLEAWRLAVRGRNLYILGPDTADGQYTPQGGTSAGTRNGVYAFIEQHLGVRWLMPGPNGDYVPKLTSVTIPDKDVQEAPFFLNRRLPYTQETTAATKQWWARQKLGYSLLISHSHNWHAIKPEAFKTHPEWFAESGGTRVPPSGEYKLCVTNPGLIRAFADAAIAFFDQNPVATSYSLSPSDGGGWCQCANCKAMYEQDPNGQLSVTPAIIHFYNEVAKLVAERYPQKVLAGYIYANYVYPPSKPFRLAPNMFLVWAPSFDYGFTLFRPEVQQQWDALAPQWQKVTDKISYYDLPNCTHNELGAINPPALKILEFLYPRLKQYGMKGVYVYGHPAWGHAGPMNYLLAKLAWDPGANVRALFDEYLTKCYAEGAPEIKQIYELLDAETEKYYLADKKESYVLSEGRLREVYGKSFAEIERLYRAAEQKVQDPAAKARLAMLGDNLTVLHWNLRQSKAVAEAEKSSFYLPDRDFFAFLKTKAGSLALAPPSSARLAAPAGQQLVVKPAQVAHPDPVKPFLLRGGQQIILRPSGQGPVEISFSNLTARGARPGYRVYDATGALADQGVVGETPCQLDGTSPYYQFNLAGGSHTLRLQVKNANWAVYGRTDDKGLHLLNQTTPLYFEVPAGVKSFGLWIAAEPPGETAAATLYAPDGRPVTTFSCTEKSVDLQQITVGPQDAGMWKLVLEKAPIGVTDDVWVKPGDELPGYFSLAPEQALSVQKPAK